MPYFPRLSDSDDIPEEVFLHILKYLHPGETWVSCRQVSRSWKLHVDCNIERYIRHHATQLASERDRLDGICRSEGTSDHHAEPLQADSLSLEIGWNLPSTLPRESASSLLVLRFKEIELPPNDGARDLCSDNWHEKITFEGENLAIYGSDLSILRINHFMFPLMSPDALEKTDMSEPFNFGTHHVKFGEYDIEYTLTPFPNDLSEISALCIHTITAPVRSLMMCSTPRILDTEAVRSGSKSKKEERQEHEMGMESLCEPYCIGPLEGSCEMSDCKGCCSRMGDRVGYLGPELPRKGYEINDLPEVVGPGAEVEYWGIGEGSENWEQNLMVSNFPDSDILVESFDHWFACVTSSNAKYASAYNADFPSPSLPPIYGKRPQSADSIRDNTIGTVHRLRRVSSCF